jgi:hypothetical protein
MILRRLFGVPFIAEFVACSLGLVASLVPTAIYTSPFWGANTFVDRELFSNDAPGVIVTLIDAGSPLEAAGLRPHDRVITLNSKPVQFGNFREILAKVEPGEAITIEVQRGGKDVRLEYQGETPKLEAVVFYNWQFVSAPAFLVVLLLFMATQPLIPAPLWRAILVTLVGLGIVTVTTVIEATQWVPWTPVWRSRSIDGVPSPALHLTLAATVLLTGLALSVLGALGVRTVLRRGAHRQPRADASTAEAIGRAEVGQSP